jgi:hypothetical protein
MGRGMGRGLGAGSGLRRNVNSIIENEDKNS